MNKEQTRLKLVELLLATRPNLSVGVVMLEVEKLIKFIYRDTVLEQFKKNTAHLYEEPTIEEDTLIHEVDSAGTINYGFDPHKVPGDEPGLGEVRIIRKRSGDDPGEVVAIYHGIPKDKEEEAKLLHDVCEHMKQMHLKDVLRYQNKIDNDFKAEQGRKEKPWGDPVDHSEAEICKYPEDPTEFKTTNPPLDEQYENPDKFFGSREVKVKLDDLDQIKLLKSLLLRLEKERKDKAYSMGLHGNLVEEDSSHVNRVNTLAEDLLTKACKQSVTKHTNPETGRSYYTRTDDNLAGDQPVTNKADNSGQLEDDYWNNLEKDWIKIMKRGFITNDELMYHAQQNKAEQTEALAGDGTPRLSPDQLLKR